MTFCVVFVSFLLNEKRMRSVNAALFFTAVLCFTAATPNSNKPLYKAVGDHAVLTPDSVPDTITTIMWKHGLDIAVEWYKDTTHAYRHFKGRVMLNSSTGALTITGLTRNDSGNYTAEINNNQVSKPTQLLVISPVSKPSVSTWCDPDMTYCVFTCEGNTTDAEPIIYWFGASDMVWPSTNVHNITKDEKEPQFSCMLENPVSFKSSEEVLNPFTTRNRPYLSACLIPLVGVILLVCLLFFLHKRREGTTVEGTAQEISVMLHDQETPSQDPTSVGSPDTNNVTVISEVQETQTSDSASPVSPETSDETEISAVILEVQETQTSDSASPASPETNDETEAPETVTQDPTPVASPDTCDETERSSVISETSDQDPTSPASPHTSNETEDSAVMSSG